MRKPDRDAFDGLEIGPVAEVLDRIGAQRRLAQQAEAAELAAVVEWADLRRVESPVHGSHPGPRGTEGVLVLAGTGARGLAEFAVCQVAATLGLSERATRTYLGEALELRDRLPRLYAKALAGVLPVWRARQVAEQTRPLSPEVAAFVDAHLSEFAHRISGSRVRRCVEAALLQCDPDSARARAEEVREQRRVEVMDHLDGITTLTAVLNTPDAAGLEHRVTVVAEWLAVLGDVDALQVRRARALALLADPQAALDFEQRCYDHARAGTQPSVPGAGFDGVGVVGVVGTAPTFHLHLHTTSELALSPVARAEAPGRRLPVSLAAVEQWLAEVAPDAVLELTPVVDTGQLVAVDGYEVPVRLQQQVAETQLVCGFPFCGRHGRYDLDHIEEYVPPDDGGPPGQTNSHNLARLCRFHHRVKTHSAWDYWREPDGSLMWESPTGARFRVDPSGTTRL